jgi:hypothetical protein
LGDSTAKPPGRKATRADEILCGFAPWRLGVKKMPPRRGCNGFGFWFYKYAAPDGAGERGRRVKLATQVDRAAKAGICQTGAMPSSPPVVIPFIF